MTKTPKVKKRVSQPRHQSLRALPKLKGGYYRRIKDIDRALEREELDFDNLPEVVQFLFLFFGCEKLALAMMGIDARHASEDAYGKGRFVLLRELQNAAKAMSISITAAELDAIFGPADTSARELRHKIVHDFGPSNVKRADANCKPLVATMRKFLDCIEEIHEYQRKSF
jgi:hypothetical protein